MVVQAPTAAERLQDVIDLRRREFQSRLLLTGLVAVCLGGLAGWRWTLAWLAATMVFQVLVRVIHRWLQGAGLAPRTAVLANAAVLSAMHAVNGSIVLAAAFTGGVWGLIDAQIIVLAVAVYSITSSRSSNVAFVAALSPYAVYMAIMAVIALRSGSPLAGPLGFIAATGLFIVSFILVHRSAMASVHGIEEARARAEAATAAKSQFIAVVSHELRTPISGILAGAAELERLAESRPARAHASLIGDAARMMRTLLNDLLDMSKIEAGRMHTEEIAFDLRALMLNTVRFWGPEAAKSGLRLRLKGSHGLPAWVLGDPTRIRQVLNNLMSNALKFTQQGQVTLSFTATRPATGGTAVTMAVADTGAGMDAGQMARLFQPFDQLSASTARTHGGTGLGLHISRQLARLMGGDLTAESRPAQGAIFRLSLVLPIAAPVADQQDPAAISPTEGLRVLVVDDHEVNRLAFGLMLEPVCREVTAVESGERALELARQAPFDIVLMDLNMPGIGGLEATRRLRAEAANATLGIIALSGAQDIDACRAAGMDGFVMKPVEAAELFGAIETVLAGAGWRAPAETAARDAASA